MAQRAACFMNAMVAIDIELDIEAYGSVWKPMEAAQKDKKALAPPKIALKRDDEARACFFFV